MQCLPEAQNQLLDESSREFYMTQFRPRRSALYMPASNARALEKAPSLGADCIILDLEDAVAIDLKESARAAAGAKVKSGALAGKEAVIRVNGIGTPWFEDDMAAAFGAGPDAILVPKVSCAQDIVEMVRLREVHGGANGSAFWAMIETPMAILNIQDILKTAQTLNAGLTCLVLGNNDLAKEARLRLAPGRAVLMPWMMQAVAGARAYGLDILDAVFNDIADVDGFEAECAQAREMGFDGKSLIHPKQLDVANQMFQPSAAEVEEAQAIVAAFAVPENATKGAIMLNGRMVERLHLDVATRLLAFADAIAQ